MKLKTLFSLIIILLFYTYTNCQDSISIKTSVDINLDSRHILTAINSNRGCINCSNGEISDNPINHLGLYGLPKFNLSINDKYSCKIGLLLEERGFSFGNYTRNNLIAIPYFNFEIIDTFNIAGIKVKQNLQAGDLWNSDVNDIIRLFNIDYQGVNSKLGIGKVWLGLLVVADLSTSIGLNIGEIHRFSIGYQNDNIHYIFSLNNNIQISLPQGEDISFSNYFRKTIKDYTIQAQFDFKLNNIVGNGIASSIRIDYFTEHIELSNTIRYYSSNYNLGFKNDNINYINRGQLYPLKNYDRDIAQWAFFTNLQNSDLVSYEIVSSKFFRIKDRLTLQSKLDCNFIYDITNSNVSIFPAYEVNLEFRYFKKLKFKIGVTNKHMELLSFYQSSSLSTTPFITYGFSLDLQEINERKSKKEYH